MIAAKVLKGKVIKSVEAEVVFVSNGDVLGDWVTGHVSYLILPDTARSREYRSCSLGGTDCSLGRVLSLSNYTFLRE